MSQMKAHTCIGYRVFNPLDDRYGLRFCLLENLPIESFIGSEFTMKIFTDD